MQPRRCPIRASTRTVHQLLWSSGRCNDDMRWFPLGQLVSQGYLRFDEAAATHIVIMAAAPARAFGFSEAAPLVCKVSFPTPNRSARHSGSVCSCTNCDDEAAWSYFQPYPHSEGRASLLSASVLPGEFWQKRKSRCLLSSTSPGSRGDPPYTSRQHLGDTQRATQSAFSSGWRCLHSTCPHSFSRFQMC